MNEKSANEEYQTLNFNNLQIKHRLGRGSTSHVLKTQSIRTKKYYAMKVIDKSSSNYQLKLLKQEIQIHQKLQFPYICQFIRHFQDQLNHYIVTQYCKDGELTKLLFRPITRDQIFSIINQIGSALHYMHNQVRFAHGDLKLSNILINGPNLKLCDFGLSVDLASPEQKQKQDNGPFGTLIYMAPQILKNNQNKHHKQADIWAFGICLLSLVLQGKPYTAESNNHLKKQIINGEYIKPTKNIITHFSQPIIQLIIKMLQPDHRLRITTQQILHFVQFYNPNKVKKQKSRSNILTIPQPKLPLIKQNAVQLQQQKQQNIQQTSQKQQINKSIFNATIDTQTQLQQLLNVTPSNPSIYQSWTYSLKVQHQQINQNCFIQILNNHSAKIQLNKVLFVISPDATNLSVLTNNNSKKYCIDQMKNNQKIYHLFQYGLQLIGILKKKQVLKEEIINEKYFWASKKSIGCLIDSQTLFERMFGQQQIVINKIGSENPLVIKVQHKQYIKIFEKGQRYLLSQLKINKSE